VRFRFLTKTEPVLRGCPVAKRTSPSSPPNLRTSEPRMRRREGSCLRVAERSEQKPWIRSSLGDNAAVSSALLLVDHSTADAADARSVPVGRRRCGRSRRSDQTRGRLLLDASRPGAAAALFLVASVIRVVRRAQRDPAARQARVVSARRPRLAALDRRRGLACRRGPDQEPGRRFGNDGGRERPPLQVRR
jgi:hypothetical protein